MKPAFWCGWCALRYSDRPRSHPDRLFGYRVVAGVKIHSAGLRRGPTVSVTVELTEVQPNVAIDASKFDRPAPAQVRNDFSKMLVAGFSPRCRKSKMANPGTTVGGL